MLSRSGSLTFFVTVWQICHSDHTKADFRRGDPLWYRVTMRRVKSRSDSGYGPKTCGARGSALFLHRARQGSLSTSSSDHLPAFEDIQIRRSPFPKSASARFLIDQRTPTQEVAGLSNIADVARLIARPPAVKFHRNFTPGKFLHEFPELRPNRDGVRRSAADIKYFPCRPVDSLGCQAERPHKIIHEQHVSDLLAIAVDRDRSSGQHRDYEVRQPTLILGPKLARAINAAHPEDDGWQVINSSIVPHVLIRRSFRAAVGRMKIERLCLRDTVWAFAEAITTVLLNNRHVFHSAIDLIRRRKY